MRLGMQDAKMDKKSIEQIVLVGGSTRIPKVRLLRRHTSAASSMSDAGCTRG